MSSQRGDAPIVIFYVLFFMTVGISLPFMPGYLKALGLSATQAGVLLAVGPTFALFAPPLWGQLADRTGRPGLVLFIVSLGAAAGFALLATVRSFPLVLAAFALHSVFASAITTLIDALALHHVHARGGTYAGLRIFGSLGFVVSSLGFGFAVSEIDRTTVLAPLVLLVCCAAWAGVVLARIPRTEHAGPRPTVAAALTLLRRPDVSVFLAATALHWIACAPYHGSLAPHVISIGLSPRIVSLSAAMAVTAEVVVMFTWSRWNTRISPRRLMMVAFGASALRWAIMAWTDSGAVLVAVALLHGLTFGAFYLASVAWMAERAPGSLRATGQSLFVAMTFGVGGLIGYVSAGRIYDAIGGHKLFGLAVVAELLPLIVIALVPTAQGNLPAPASE